MAIPVKGITALEAVAADSATMHDFIFDGCHPCGKTHSATGVEDVPTIPRDMFTPGVLAFASPVSSRIDRIVGLGADVFAHCPTSLIVGTARCRFVPLETYARLCASRC